MRMILVLGGLLLAAAFVSSTPTQAAGIGCACVKLGAPVTCTATVIECNMNVGGVCLSACEYEPPKKGKRAKKKKM
jgi:hypothetical protein